jgi:hypothetical protein
MQAQTTIINSDMAASGIASEPNSNIRDEIGTIDDSAPVRVSYPEQIADDDEEPVPWVHVAAAISDGKLAAKETAVSSEEVHDADEGLLETSDAVLDADDEPLRPTNRIDTRGTEPTAVLTLSSENATAADTHMIEAYLVEDEELPIYDAMPELPWWKQRRFRIMILLVCILILSVAALLAVFLKGNPSSSEDDPSSSIFLEATSSLSPSSAPSASLFPSLNPHTSPKVSLVVS